MFGTWINSVATRFDRPSRFCAALLVTGTTLALYGQFITNVGATDPKTQIIAWTKYAVNLLISTVVVAGPRRKPKPGPKGNAGSKPVQPEAEILAVACGLLDVVAYGMNCIGFPKCGSALSMVVFAACGQIFTAIARRLLLGRRMTRQQTAAVGMVTTGLLYRAVGNISNLVPGVLGGPTQWVGALRVLLSASGAGGSAQHPQVAVGVAYIIASAAGYSLLGVLYERMVSMPGNHLTHAQINLRMSLVGVLALSLYQATFTWPHRRHLVLDLMHTKGLTPAYVITIHAVFGSLFTIHSFVQGRVLEYSSALAVGIVNALRAATVTVASSMLFCGPSAPHQCLTVRSGTSAAIITAGAVMWATAPQPAKRTSLKPPGGEKPKDKEA